MLHYLCRNCNFRLNSRRSLVNCVHDGLNIRLKSRLLLRIKHNNRNLSVFEVLLVSQVAIRSQNQVKAILLDNSQQIAVSQFIPALLCRGSNQMCAKELSNKNRSRLIEKYLHHGQSGV